MLSTLVEKFKSIAEMQWYYLNFFLKKCQPAVFQYKPAHAQNALSFAKTYADIYKTWKQMYSNSLTRPRTISKLFIQQQFLKSWKYLMLYSKIKFGFPFSFNVFYWYFWFSETFNCLYQNITKHDKNITVHLNLNLKFAVITKMWQMVC